MRRPFDGEHSVLFGGSASYALSCSSMGLSLTLISSGRVRLLITSALTTHLRTPSSDGMSYITSSSTSSIVVRRPRAPVLRFCGLLGGGHQRVLGEDQLNVVKLKNMLLKLLDDRVRRLDENPHQVVRR